jgi:phytoene dehydrogenase-like protein
MKAAAVAAERGHDVTLLERARRVGGQAVLAEQLPGRAEFGGLITNLERELHEAGVTVELGVAVTAELLRQRRPELVVLATGADPLAAPELPGGSTMTTVSAAALLAGESLEARHAVIADARCDWVAVGIAEMLARRGTRVSLAVTGALPAEAVQSYVRDEALARLARLHVGFRSHLHLFGADDDTVYFRHVTSKEPVMIEEVEALVLSHPAQSRIQLAADLAAAPFEVIEIGDCLAPRTAEEAVLDGLRVAVAA